MPFIPEPVCPACSAATPTPWLGIPRESGPGSGLTIPCGAPTLQPPFMRLGESVVDAGELFAPGTAPKLREHVDAQWIAAAEPKGWLDEARDPLYAAVTPDGTSALTVLKTTFQGLGIAGPQQPPPDPIEPAIASNSPSRGGPPPRRRHLAVLSAGRQRLWVGGGVAPTPLRADEGAVSLAVRPPRGAPEVVAYERQELRPAGEGAVRRCF